MDNTVKAITIVNSLLEDLQDRRGLRHEWEQIDDEIIQEIVNY